MIIIILHKQMNKKPRDDDYMPYINMICTRKSCQHRWVSRGRIPEYCPKCRQGTAIIDEDVNALEDGFVSSDLDTTKNLPENNQFRKRSI